MNVLLSKKRSLEHTRRKESLDLLQHFLATAKSKREEQLRRLQTELQVVSKDLKSVEGELRRLKSRDNDDDIDEPTVSWADDEAGLGANDSIVSGDDDEKEDLSVPAVGADHPDLKRKRKRQVGGLVRGECHVEKLHFNRSLLHRPFQPNTAPERGATLRAAAHVPSDVAEGPTQQSRSPRITESVKRLEPHQADLEDGYFSLRIRDSAGQQLGTHAELESFGSELSKISSKARFRTVANLHYADSLSGSQNSIVSAIVFDKDDEFFATAGVTKKIKVFEFASLTQGERPKGRARSSNSNEPCFALSPHSAYRRPKGGPDRRATCASNQEHLATNVGQCPRGTRRGARGSRGFCRSFTKLSCQGSDLQKQDQVGFEGIDNVLVIGLLF